MNSPPRLSRHAAPPRATTVPDETARTIHAQLRRVIHLLPPTMLVTVFTAAGLIVWQIFQTDHAWMAWIVALVFFGQQTLIIRRLKKDIDAVDGLGALALLHHRGLLSILTTFIAQIVLILT